MIAKLLLVLFVLSALDGQGQRSIIKYRAPSSGSYDSTKAPEEFVGARLYKDSATGHYFLNLTFQRTPIDIVRKNYGLDSITLFTDTGYIAGIAVNRKDTLCMEGAKPFCQWSFIFLLKEEQFEFLLLSEVNKVELIIDPKYMFGNMLESTMWPTLYIRTYYPIGDDKRAFQNMQPVRRYFITQ